MKDLASLLRRLNAIRIRLDTEKRKNGKTAQWQELKSQYYNLLHQVGKATE